MRALIELPLNSNVDLKSVYSIIEEINNQYTRTDEALTAPPKIVGPQTKPNGQFVFTIALMTKNGLQHATYQRYFNTLSRSTAKTRHRPFITSHPIFNQLKRRPTRLLFLFPSNSTP